MDHIVRSDHTHQPPGIVDHGRRNQCIFLEAQCHFFLVHIDRDQRLFALHHVGNRNVARRAHDPAQLAGANRAMRGIDNEDFPEFSRQILVFAQIIDQLADSDMLWHRDQFALHDTTGGFFGIGKRILDDSAVFGIEFGKDSLLLVLLHILDHSDRVVGLHLLGKVGDLSGGQRIDDIVAHPIIDFREHVGAEQIAQGNGERSAILTRGQFEQVGNVGSVQRLGEAIGLFAIASFDCIENLIDKVGFQPIILVERAVDCFNRGEIRIGFGSHRPPFAADCYDRASPTPTKRKCNLLLPGLAYCERKVQQKDSPDGRNPHHAPFDRRRRDQAAP